MRAKRTPRTTETHRETPSFAPRLFNRRGAAYYISSSTSYLDALVLQDVLKPVPLPSTRGGGTTRVPLFDRADLDLVIDQMKAVGGSHE